MIPDGIAAAAIEREYAVDARVEQAGEKKILLERRRGQGLDQGIRHGELQVVGMVLIVAHIRRLVSGRKGPVETGRLREGKARQGDCLFSI